MMEEYTKSEEYKKSVRKFKNKIHIHAK